MKNFDKLTSYNLISKYLNNCKCIFHKNNIPPSYFKDGNKLGKRKTSKLRNIHNTKIAKYFATLSINHSDK